MSTGSTYVGFGRCNPSDVIEDFGLMVRIILFEIES